MTRGKYLGMTVSVAAWQYQYGYPRLGTVLNKNISVKSDWVERYLKKIQKAGIKKIITNVYRYLGEKYIFVKDYYSIIKS